ncbi:MAG: hypothetical protein HQ551_06675 [Desulfobacteraceae bacterium]|nr:hypothetical protein [Desulfobacteraceae bacterium]
MSHFDEIISPYYYDIIQETEKHATNVSGEVDMILDDIRKNIRSIDPKVFSKRNELLFAIRLVEAFRIFNWIKVCLTCGSYQSVFRELRFMLDGVAQACYIDLNHSDTSLTSKLEVYKALGDIGGFIGSSLFDRIKGFQEKQKLKDLYRDLSRFVHPSIEESRKWIESPPPEGVVDSLKFNRYDRELFDEALEKSKQVGKLLVSLNNHFVEQFLKHI